MTFQNLSDKIDYNKEAIAKGEVNFLPLYYTFPRFIEFLPGLIKSDYLLLSAGAKVGKTKFTHFLCSELLRLMEIKPNLKVNIVYNSLEESVEKFKSAYLLKYMYSKGCHLNYYGLMGYSETPLTDYEIQIKDEAVSYYTKNVEPYLEVVTELSSVKFYKHCEAKMLSTGKVINGEYVANDPNEWWIFVSDHIGCYVKEPGMTQGETLHQFSAILTRNKLCKFYNAVCILVQQQINTKDAIEANVKPKTLIEKVKPSIDGLADHKGTGRDATIVLGLFNPHKWIEHIPGRVYKGISLDNVQMRTLCFIATREGAGLEDSEYPMYFNGATNQFTEISKF